MRFDDNDLRVANPTNYRIATIVADLLQQAILDANQSLQADPVAATVFDTNSLSFLAAEQMPAPSTLFLGPNADTVVGAVAQRHVSSDLSGDVALASIRTEFALIAVR